MADNKPSNVANLIERTRTGAKETPVPQYARTADLINRTIGARNLSSQSGNWKSLITDPYAGQYKEAPVVKKQEPDWVAELANPVNPIGWTLRALTSLGRGVTNAVASGLERGVEFTKAVDKGDTAKAVNEAAMLLPDMAWGTVKGIADSFLPEFDSWIKDIDSRPIYEGAYDVLKSDVYKQAAEIDKKQTGGDTFMQDIASEKPIGRIGTKEFGLDITPVGLIATTWDIFTDPASYLTFGIGGAVRGASKGISAVKAFQKAGKPEMLKDVPLGALPSPIYQGEKGAKAFTPPKYNVANTSPAYYVLREMGRGFKEAHMRAWNISSKHAQDRSFAAGFLTHLTENLSGTKTLAEIEEVISSPDYVDSLAEGYMARVGATTGKSAEEVKQIAESSVARLIEEIKARPEVVRETFSPDNQARLLAAAEANGTTLVSESAQQLAARFVRSFPNRRQVFVTKTPLPLDEDSVAGFVRVLEGAAASPEGADVAAAFNDFKASVDPGTWNTIIRHLSTNPSAKIKKGKNLDTNATEGLTTAGGRGRGVTNDEFENVRERQPGTKGTKIVAQRKMSDEEKYLLGQGKRMKDQRFGAKSALTAGSVESRPNIWTADEVAESARKLRDVFARAGATSPSEVTGEMLAAAGISPSLLSARMSFLIRPQQSEAYKYLTQAAEFGYNPFTARVEAVRMSALPVNLAGKQAAKEADDNTPYLLTIVKAAQDFNIQVNDPQIINVLSRLGLTEKDIDSFLTSVGDNGVGALARINEELLGARVTQALNLRELEVERILKQERDLRKTNPTEEELAAEEFELQKELAKLGEGKQLFNRYIRMGALPSNKELDDVAVKLQDLYEARLKAVEKLDSLGYNPYAPEGKIITAGLTATRAAIKTKTTAEKGLTALKKALKVTLPKNGGTRDEVFGALSRQLKAFDKANPAKTPGVQEAFDNVKRLLSTLEDKTYTRKEAMEVLARLGNFTRKTGQEETFGSSAYNLAFRNKRGEINEIVIPSFLLQAYRSSRNQTGDGGVFANYIDRLLKRAQLPPLSEIPQSQQLSAVAKLRDVWRGEELSTELLIAMSRDTARQGVKKGALPEVKASVRQFLDNLSQDAARFEQELREEAVNRIIEMDGGLDALIKANDDAFISVKSGDTGNILKAIAKTPEEEALVKDAIESAVLPIRVVEQQLRRLEQLGAGVSQTVIGRGYIDWRKYKPKAFDPAMLEPTRSLKISPEQEIQMLRTQVYFAGLRAANRDAMVAVSRGRAGEIVASMFPAYATAPELMKAARKLVENNAALASQAGDLVRARVMLAERIMNIDLALRAEYQTSGTLSRVSTPGIKRKTVATQKETLNKFLVQAEQKFSKAGFLRGPDSIEGMTLEEVLATENPLKLTEFIRTFVVKSNADKETWATAIEVLKKYSLVDGKRAAYKDVNSFLRSFVDNRRQLRPGEVNPVTNSPVPKPEDILRLLALKSADGSYAWGTNPGRKAEEALMSGVMPTDANIKRWIRDGLPKADYASALEVARRNDFIRASHMVAADDVRQITETLEQPQVVADQFSEAYNRLLEELTNSGQQEIIDFGALMVGQSLRKFILEGAAFDSTFTDKLGRLIRTDSPEVGKRKAIKYNFDKENNYTGWKALLQNLQALADRNGLAVGTAERAEFMSAVAMQSLRFRDAFLHARGIFPSTTVDLKSGEAAMLGMFGDDITDAARESAKRGVFLSEADIMDVLGKDVAAELFFAGKIGSLPVTSVLGPARLLLMAMENLPPGGWFTEEQLSTLIDSMYGLMVNHIKKVTSATAEGKITIFDVNPELAYEKIRVVVSNLVDVNKADRLFQTHKINAAYATKVLRYKSMQVTAPIIDGWLRALSSPLNPTGNKIQDTLDAFDALYKAIGEEADPNLQLMIETDAKVQMAANLDPDSLIILREAAETADTWETEGIKSIVGANKRKQSRAASAQQRAPLTDIMLGNKLVKAAENNVPEEYIYDVFNETIVAQQEINWFLKGFTGVTERAFASTGMENLRALYAPSEIAIQNEIDMYANVITAVARHYTELAPNRAIMAEAWSVLREMPEEALNKFAHAWEISKQLRDRRSTIELDMDTRAQLVDDIAKFKEALPSDDEVLTQAVIDLWKAAGPLVGGGKYSLVMRAGLDPRVINRHLREIGAGRKVDAIDENGNYVVKKDGYGFPNSKTIADVQNAWRDWDLTNPLEALLGLSQALRQASKVPEMAVTVDRMFGTPITEFKSAKEAAAAGLVRIKSVDSPSMGKELVHYMQTDKFYYPAEIALELKRFSEFLTEIKRMQPTGAMERALLAVAPIQNFMKQQSTLFTPKNWVQNLIGGYWSNFMGGVNNPVAATIRSTKLLQSRGLNPDALGFDMTKIDNMWAEQASKARKQNLVIKSINDPTGDGLGVKIRGQQAKFGWADLSRLFEQNGGMPPYTQSIDLDELRPSLIGADGIQKAGGLKKLYGKYQKSAAFLGKWASERDAHLRAQLWLDILAKGNWTSLEAGAREAMKIVNRYHPQMQDLSTFNQVVTRQLVLFFTWRAKTLSWILMDMLDKPGRILAPLKAQYNLTQNEDIQYKQFGDFDPMGFNLPSYNQNNMDPLFMTGSGALGSVSVANPVTDLLGSTGWLSGINWSNYESGNPLVNAGANIANSVDGTIRRFALTAEPIVISTLIDYAKGTSFNGTRIGNGQGNFSVLTDPPALVEDFANRLGLGYTLTIASGLFPDQFVKASMIGENKEYIQNEGFRAWFNWLTGLKYTQEDTLKMRKKGVQEILQKIKEAYESGAAPTN